MVCQADVDTMQNKTIIANSAPGAMPCCLRPALQPRSADIPYRTQRSQEGRLLLTGVYRPWVSFAGFFGQNGIWAAWSENWPAVLATSESLARLRDDTSSEANAAALKALAALKGMGARYLAPHCIRSWGAVLEECLVEEHMACSGQATSSASGQECSLLSSPLPSSASGQENTLLSSALLSSASSEGWGVYEDMSDGVANALSRLGSPSPAPLARAIGAPQLRPPQLALLLCEAHSLTSWWTGPSGRNGGVGRTLEELVSRLPGWSGPTLRQQAFMFSGRLLLGRGVYHSATSLLRDVIDMIGGVDSIPRRPAWQAGLADWHGGLCASVGPTTALQLAHITSALPPWKRIGIGKTGDALELHCKDMGQSSSAAHLSRWRRCVVKQSSMDIELEFGPLQWAPRHLRQQGLNSLPSDHI